jgi:hypothetical protein
LLGNEITNYIILKGATIANSTVSNNLMMRSVGNRESTGYPPNAFVNGIYLDDNS